MPKAERGIVKTPNAGIQGRPADAQRLSCRWRSRRRPSRPSNLSRFMHGDSGGSTDLARQPSAVPEPNRRFDVDNVNNSQIDISPSSPAEARSRSIHFSQGGPGWLGPRIADDSETF